MGFQNFFASRLATDIGASDNAITLEQAPTATSGRMVLEARNTTKREIVRYTGVSGNQLTGVTRGQGGTTASDHKKTALIEMNVTAEDLTEALGLSFAFPTGIVMPYAGSITPSGWLAADGAAVSRTTYAALFTALGTTFGAGDGSTTFNLPNLKGRIPVGRDAAQTEFDTLGETGGAKTHTLTVAQMPVHSHAPRTGSNFLETSGSVTGYTDLSGAGNYKNVNTSTGDAGGGQAHNILQPYIALNYIIKT